MKDCGGHFHGKHLKSSLEYILKPEKTQDGRLVGAVNCQVDTAFEQMKETKRLFGKIDKRQGYHLILSFNENEVDPDTAVEITQKFVQEYLGKDYEAVYAVHDNTEHVHSHIIFNSVSFVSGKKYRYEKGDWARDIQPITNRLCEEYGLSIIDIEEGKGERENENYKDWSEYREGKFVWADMIKRDLDSCIIQANSFDDFVDLLKEKGYETKQGKHLAVKPPGMTRFKRCMSLGENYSEEQIWERIKQEDLAFYQSQKESAKPQIVKCYIKQYKRARMSGLQKRYYAKLYRIGQLKKKPYSQVWKYKNDIRKMLKLQQQYLFLARHDIHNVVDLAATIENLTDKRKESSSEKSKVYRARQRCVNLFAILDELEVLKPAEDSYQKGDQFFVEEHNQWNSFLVQLHREGYSLEEVEELRRYYKEQIASASAKEKVVFRELNLGKSIWNDIVSEKTEKTKQEEMSKEKEIDKDRKKQPKR
jgi:dihydrofolate reductase